jgi:hypothetical protein
MNKVFAGLKTFIAYWFMVGFISAITIVPLALLGLYNEGINVLCLFFGCLLSGAVYFYRRKK